jgi:hypothetical protein
MERRSRSWALGLSFIGFFALLFSLGFVQQVKADDVSEYGTVIGIVRTMAPILRSMGTSANACCNRIWAPHTRKSPCAQKSNIRAVLHRSRLLGVGASGHGVKIAARMKTTHTWRNKALTGSRCVGVMQKGKVEILVNDQGALRATPRALETMGHG